MTSFLSSFFGSSSKVESEVHYTKVPVFLEDHDLLSSNGSLEKLLSLTKKHGFDPLLSGAQTPFIAALVRVSEGSFTPEEKELETKSKKFVEDVKASGLHVFELVAELRRLQRSVLPRLQQEEGEARTRAGECSAKAQEWERRARDAPLREVLRAFHFPDPAASDLSPAPLLNTLNAAIAPLLAPLNDPSAPLHQPDYALYFDSGEAQEPPAPIASLTDLKRWSARVCEFASCLRAASLGAFPGKDVEITTATGQVRRLGEQERVGALAAADAAYAQLHGSKEALQLWQLLELRDGEGSWDRFLAQLQRAQEGLRMAQEKRTIWLAREEEARISGAEATRAIGDIRGRLLPLLQSELEAAVKAMAASKGRDIRVLGLE